MPALRASCASTRSPASSDREGEVRFRLGLIDEIIRAGVDQHIAFCALDETGKARGIPQIRLGASGLHQRDRRIARNGGGQRLRRLSILPDACNAQGHDGFVSHDLQMCARAGLRPHKTLRTGVQQG